jgi:hypothetical protein
LRQTAGIVALVSYLLMGAMTYLTVLPGADWYWPPDFHLTGYDAQSVAPFVEAISDKARTTYGVILSKIDRVFIVALALWLALMGWRGGWVRYFIVGLAAIYAAIDLAENAAISRFMFTDVMDPVVIETAHHLTMAKFASLYLCVLVLIVHLRRTA